MKPARFLSFIAAALLALAGSQTASAFEGRLDMQISNLQKNDESIVMHYAVKGQKLRIDLPQQAHGRNQNGSMATVIDNDTHQMLILIDSGDGHKMAMRRQLPDPKAQTSTAHNNSSNSSSDLNGMHPPVATGRTDVILGYPVSEYTMKDKDGNTIDMWLAKGLGTFMNPSAGGPFSRGRSSAAVPAEWQKFAETAGFFPMRMTVQDKKDKVTMKMEVTKLDKSSVPDSAFSSEGYQEMQMPSFGSMFGH
jgi:hypothetical protein